MLLKGGDDYPVEIIKCSHSISGQSGFSRYSYATQLDSCPFKTVDVTESFGESSMDCKRMSNYIRKLNTGSYSCDHLKLYSSVCFPSNTRESLIGRISQGCVSNNIKPKVPTIKLCEGSFRSLKIVKPVQKSMLKIESCINIDTKKYNKPKSQKIFREYIRRNINSNITLDNISNHKTNAKLDLEHKDIISGIYFVESRRKPHGNYNSINKDNRQSNCCSKKRYITLMKKMKDHAM